MAVIYETFFFSKGTKNSVLSFRVAERNYKFKGITLIEDIIYNYIYVFYLRM